MLPNIKKENPSLLYNLLRKPRILLFIDILVPQNLFFRLRTVLNGSSMPLFSRFDRVI